MVTKHVPHKFTKGTTTRTERPDFISPSVISVGSDAMIQETTQFINKKNDEYNNIVKETDLTRKILREI
jgi:hypothetical protein